MKLFFQKDCQPLVERTYKVKGLMCSHCEMNVKNRLSAIPGVKEVAASVPLGKVSLSATADVTDQMIKDAIAAAGYSVVEPGM